MVLSSEAKREQKQQQPQPVATVVSVETALKEKNYEQLVQFVLDGRGDEIAERVVKDEEVQEFIDNIPAFQVQ